MEGVLAISLSDDEKLSERDFRYICKLVYDNTGIVLKDSKRDMVCRRLMRRQRALKLADSRAYCDFLKAEQAQELPSLINAVTTNLTSFFREEHHFRYLESFIERQLLNPALGNRLRIWSAACSTGEEAYSLAITVAQTMKQKLYQWDVKILATDLDTNVLAEARQGIYDADACKSLSKATCLRWFSKGTGKNEGLIRVKPELRQMIQFNQLNFMEHWPVRGPFDVIMCRNALIYFDRPTQNALISRFIHLLRPGGVLFLGHSESIGKGMAEIEVKGRTIFERKGRHDCR